MSKVIKSSRVLYDRDPKVISIYHAADASVEKQEDTIGQVLSKNALEDADIALKAALVEVDEVKKRGQVETQLAYLAAMNNGRQRGYEDGLQNGHAEGENKAKEMVRAAAQEFTNNACRLDMKYYNQISRSKSDCVNFAFGLAETVLGIQINRENTEYKDMIDGFLSRQPSMATLKVDGGTYSFETLQTDGLLTCTDGLQGISVLIDAPHTIYQKDAVKKCPQTSIEPQKSAQTVSSPQPETGPGNENVRELPDSVLQETAAQIAETKAAAGREQPALYEESIAGYTQRAETTVHPRNDQKQEPAQIPEPVQQQDVTGMEPSEIHRELSTQPEDSGAQIAAEDFSAEDVPFANTADGVEDVADERNDLPDEQQGPELDESLATEKFVFVRPVRKSISKTGANGQSIQFEDFADLGAPTIKAVSRKADMKDIATALSGADEKIVTAFMDALARRTKEKVLEVMKYLGPVPQTEIDGARHRIADIAAGIAKTREREAADV